MASISAEFTLKDTDLFKRAMLILYSQLLDGRIPTEYKEQIVELIESRGD